jgi:hypothetical protein
MDRTGASGRRWTCAEPVVVDNCHTSTAQPAAGRRFKTAGRPAVCVVVGRFAEPAACASRGRSVWRTGAAGRAPYGHQRADPGAAADRGKRIHAQPPRASPALRSSPGKENFSAEESRSQHPERADQHCREPENGWSRCKRRRRADSPAVLQSCTSRVRRVTPSTRACRPPDFGQVGSTGGRRRAPNLGDAYLPLRLRARPYLGGRSIHEYRRAGDPALTSFRDFCRSDKRRLIIGRRYPRLG